MPSPQWYDLLTLRDEQGFPIGLYVKIFVENPPRFYNVQLDAHSTVNTVISENHAFMIKKLEGSVIPFYIGGDNGRCSLFSLPTSGNISKIGIANNAQFFKNVNSMLMHSHYLLLGKKDEIEKEIKMVQNFAEEAEILCYEQSDYLCTTNAQLQIHNKLSSPPALTSSTSLKTQVNVNFFTEKWQLPSALEGEIRRGYRMHEKNKHDNYAFKIVFKDIDNRDFFIECDFDCYTRHVNPFGTPTLWVDFVDNSLDVYSDTLVSNVGIPYDFIKNEKHAIQYTPHLNILKIQKTDFVPKDTLDFLNAALFFIMVIIVYRLTHNHSFKNAKITTLFLEDTNSVTGKREQPSVQSTVLKDDVNNLKMTRLQFQFENILFLTVQFFVTAMSVFLLFFTSIKIYQTLLATYLIVVFCGIVLVVNVTNPLNNRHYDSCRIFSHQLYTDILFEALISSIFYMSGDLTLFLLVIFHEVLIFDSFVAGLFVIYFANKNNASKTSKVPLLLPFIFLQMCLVSAINVFFYLNTQVKIFTTLYVGGGTENTSFFLFNSILLLVFISTGLAIRAFNCREIDEFFS